MQKPKISLHTNKLMGITSIELILTILIITILSGIIIINTNAIYKKREYNEIKRIEKSVNYARNYAITSRKRTGIAFNKNEYIIYTESSENNKLNATNIKVIEKTHLDYIEVVTKLNNKDSNNFNFIFTQNGIPGIKNSSNKINELDNYNDSGAGTMYLKGRYNKYKLVVRPVSGYIKVVENYEKP